MSHFIQFLTYFRIASSPLIFLFIVYLDFFGWALILLILASLSDYWDGYLARKYEHESVLGEILDPVADKILVTFLILALAIELSSLFIGLIGGLVLAREFWVGALRDFNSRKGRSNLTKVTFFSKIKTSLQLIAFCGYLVGLHMNNSLILFISNFLLFLALIATLQTGMHYTISTFKK